MALGSTQPLTEMSTQEHFLGVKSGRYVRLTLPPSCAVVTKSGNLNFVEPFGPVQACNGTALPSSSRLCYNLQSGHYTSLTAPNFQHTATQERDDQCGNQHCSRELLVMGIVVPETCWAHKKYNKIRSCIYLVCILRFFKLAECSRLW